MSRHRTRRLALLAASVVAAAPLVTAGAATPAEGTLTTSVRTVSWQGTTFAAGAGAVSNLVFGTGVEPVCLPAEADPLGQVCDRFQLTVDVPKGYFAKTRTAVKVTLSWPDPANKILVAAYDDKGTFVAYGFGGDPVSLLLTEPSGRYEIIADPLLVPYATSYEGTASIVPLPPAPKTPTLGGPAAFRATRVATRDPSRPPANRPEPLARDRLRLRAHDVGRGAGEPTLGADQNGRVFLASFNSDVSRVHGFNPFLLSLAPGRTRFADISDGARSVQQGSNDPYVHVDPDHGRVFWSNMVSVNGNTMSFTDDGGESWAGHTLLTSGGIDDHASIVTAPVPKGSLLRTTDPVFPKLVYHCSNSIYRVGCDRSVDGGRTFAQTATPLLEQSTHCAVSTTDHASSDRDGRIFLGSAGCGIPVVAVSEDAGLSWTNSSVSTTILSGGHDVATVADRVGNVYAGWVDDQNSLPYVASSRDHGRTWSRPMMVAAPGDHETSMLTLAAGDAGRLSVGYVGTTVNNVGDAARPWTYRMSVTTDALAAQPLFASDVVTLPGGAKIVHRGSCCGGMADFLDQQLNPRTGRAWGSLGSNCVGACERKPKDPASYDARWARGYAVEQYAGPALAAPRTPSSR